VLCCVKRVTYDSYKMRKIPLGGLEGLCDRRVRELCMCTCHTNHSVGFIKELGNQRKKKDGIYINLDTCQITVVCSVKHFMAYYLAILPLPM